MNIVLKVTPCSTVSLVFDFVRVTEFLNYKLFVFSKTQVLFVCYIPLVFSHIYISGESLLGSRYHYYSS